ncbi:F-type H+-transporting ATPase subunit a [Oscillospiraceae bacterium]|nr:F-type H+-transporting ATPase subunit a [Oscillospiraceae bacterium]
MQYKKAGTEFKLVDAMLVIMMIVPIVLAILMKVLFIPVGEGIEITGAHVYTVLNMPVSDLPISEAQVNSLAVLISILFLCLYMTHGIRAHVYTKRAVLAEWAVEKIEGLVKENMGDYFMGFAPFIGAILLLSAFSSLSSLVGLFAPTSDLNVVAGWAILVFILITYYKLKCGPWYYIKGFMEPIPLMLPMNIIGEIATPVSMTLRHYGNILSGTVISILLASALQAASNLVFGNLPGILGSFPFFRVGIPAVLSIYFDLFSGCLQAFIFSMLTMLYVSTSFPMEEYMRRKSLKEKNN